MKENWLTVFVWGVVALVVYEAIRQASGATTAAQVASAPGLQNELSLLLQQGPYQPEPTYGNTGVPIQGYTPDGAALNPITGLNSTAIPQDWSY